MLLQLHIRSSRSARPSQSGFSLIELMVALALSVLLTLGIFKLYLDSSKTTQSSRSLARIQESGRIALDIMGRDVRMAGFLGCANPLQDLSPSYTATSLDSDFYAASLRGLRVDSDDWDSGADNFAVTGLKGEAMSGTDVLQIRRTSGLLATLDNAMSSSTSVLDTKSDSAAANFSQGDLALVTNCWNADAFQVGDSDGGADDKIKHTALSSTYQEGSQVFQFRTNTYWVKDTGRDGSRGNPVFALYQNGAEVVSGVERLQILYGVRSSDNKTVRFVDAENVGNDEWNAVDAIRIGLLVSDDQPVMDTADAKSYDLPGVSVSPSETSGTAATYPDDRRLRSVFSTTIKLRNRIPQS